MHVAGYVLANELNRRGWQRQATFTSTALEILHRGQLDRRAACDFIARLYDDPAAELDPTEENVSPRNNFGETGEGPARSCGIEHGTRAGCSKSCSY
jgi:hypothetical protein